MEERTYISEQEASCIYIQVAKCNTYEDARKWLNAFVADFIREQGSKVYDGGFDSDEQGNVVRLQYVNSTNPKDVQDAVADAIRSVAKKSIRAFRLMDNTFKYNSDTEQPPTEQEFKQYIRILQGMEKASVKAIEQIEGTAKRLGFTIKKQEPLRIKHKGLPQYLDRLNANSDAAEQVIEYVGKWKTNSLPKVENEEKRLRPINQNTIEAAQKVFNWLIKEEWIEPNGENVWNYLCGISDNYTGERIKFKAKNFEMALLIGLFFIPYNDTKEFFYREGISEEYICGFFLNRLGRPMNVDAVIAEKSRTLKKYKEKRTNDETLRNLIKSLS